MNPLGPESSWKRLTLAANLRAGDGLVLAGRLALAFAAHVAGVARMVLVEVEGMAGP